MKHLLTMKFLMTLMMTWELKKREIYIGLADALDAVDLADNLRSEQNDNDNTESVLSDDV